LPVRFNQPVPVAARVEHQETEAQLLDGVERLYPEQLLLQRAGEALRAAVALGFADERGARCDAEKGQLVQEAVEQEPDDEGYTTHSPTLRGSVSGGKTFEEMSSARGCASITARETFWRAGSDSSSRSRSSAAVQS
jgi:hypothetical protein